MANFIAEIDLKTLLFKKIFKSIFYQNLNHLTLFFTFPLYY